MSERPEKFCSKCEFDCCKIRTNCQGDQKCYKVGKTDCCQEKSCCKDVKCVDRKICEDGEGNFYCKCERTCEIKVNREEDKPSCCKVGKSDCCQKKSCCKDVKCVDRKICEDGEGNFYCKCERTCEIKVNREEDKPSCCKVGKSDCCQEKSCCKDVKCVDRKICEDGEGNFYCKCERTCEIKVNREEDKPSCCKVGKSDCCQEKSCCKDVKCVDRKICEDGEGNFYCKCERTCEIKVNREEDKPSCCKVGKSDCCQEKSCCKDVKCVDRKICEDGEGNFYCKCERTCEIKVNREEDKPSCCKVGKSDCCQKKSCCKDVKCVDRKICEDGEGNFYCKCERTCEIKVNREEDKPSCCKVGKSDCCQEKSCCKDVKCVDRKICEDGEGNFYCKCERTCEIKVNRGEDKPSCCKVGKSDCCQEKSCCKDVKCVDRKICEDGEGNFYCKCERTCEIKVNREEDKPSCCEVGKSECFKEKSCCKDVKCVDRKICEDGKGSFYCKCERTCEIKVNREEDEPSCCEVEKSECCKEKSCYKNVTCADRKICRDGKGNFYCKCERTCEIKVNREEDEPSCCKAAKSDCCKEKACCKNKVIRGEGKTCCRDGKRVYREKFDCSCCGDEPFCCEDGEPDCCPDESCCKDGKINCC